MPVSRLPVRKVNQTCGKTAIWRFIKFKAKEFTKIKKFLAILLALTLVLSMAACAAAPAKTEEKTDAPAVDA